MPVNTLLCVKYNNLYGVTRRINWPLSNNTYIFETLFQTDIGENIPDKNCQS